MRVLIHLAHKPQLPAPTHTKSSSISVVHARSPSVDSDTKEQKGEQKSPRSKVKPSARSTSPVSRSALRVEDNDDDPQTARSWQHTNPFANPDLKGARVYDEIAHHVHIASIVARLAVHFGAEAAADNK